MSNIREGKQHKFCVIDSFWGAIESINVGNTYICQYDNWEWMKIVIVSVFSSLSRKSIACLVSAEPLPLSE